MIRILSDGDVADLLDLEDLLDVVEDAFRKQGRGEVERPDRPHFPVGRGLDPDHPGPLGTGLVMPAYLHGAPTFATKIVSVHEGNAERGLPTVTAEIVLADAATGRPAALLAGTRITNARTGCIGGLAARHLADPPVRLAIIGAGTQARVQARAIAAATTVEEIRVYSPSESKAACASALEAELGVPAEPAASPEDAVAGATVVVTATTATAPVFPGDALSEGALVIAVGAYNADGWELDRATFDRAGRVFADVPEEVAGIGDVVSTGVDPDRLEPLSAVFLATAGRGADDEIIVVESVGTAVLDAAAAGHVLERAEARGVGRSVEL